MENNLCHADGLNFIIDKWVTMKDDEQDKKIFLKVQFW